MSGICMTQSPWLGNQFHPELLSQKEAMTLDIHSMGVGIWMMRPGETFIGGSCASLSKGHGHQSTSIPRERLTT